MKTLDDSEYDDYQEELALPKIPLPVRPFLIRYIAQDRGPELENAPGFILQSWVQKQQELGPNFQHPEKEKKRRYQGKKIISKRETVANGKKK